MLASHVIFTTHGFWLPNDPRGSWSTHVRQHELYLAAGAATTTDARHSFAKAAHDRTVRRKARAALKYPAVRLTAGQATLVAAAIERSGVESEYPVHALAVMPGHVHAVIATRGNPPGRIVGHLKARCTQALVAAGLHPFVARRGENGRFPEFWAHQAWKVFLETVDDVVGAIKYVEQTPTRAGMRRQTYSFLTPFEAPR